MKNVMIIVNYNDAKTTIKLLDNIKDYKCLDKIIVVDNKSTDNSLSKLNNYNLKKLEVIQTKENKGYSYALNIGAKSAIKEYKECNLIISNADILIYSENDLKELISNLSNQNVIVAPNIIEDNTLNRGWHIPTPSQDILLNIPKIREKCFNRHLKYDDLYYSKKLSKVEAVSGCFFLITSKHLEDINFFDENVFLYYEENILGIKTKQKNKNIIINNDVDVVHEHSKTVDKSLKRINKYKILKQSQYYFEKNYNKANKLQLFLLKLTAGITKIILSIKYLID